MKSVPSLARRWPTSSAAGRSGRQAPEVSSTCPRLPKSRSSISAAVWLAATISHDHPLVAAMARDPCAATGCAPQSRLKRGNLWLRQSALSTCKRHGNARIQPEARDLRSADPAAVWPQHDHTQSRGRRRHAQSPFDISPQNFQLAPVDVFGRVFAPQVLPRRARSGHRRGIPGLSNVMIRQRHCNSIQFDLSECVTELGMHKRKMACSPPLSS